MLDPADPYFLTVNDVSIAFFNRRGSEAGRVRAGVGFGDAETLEPDRAVRNFGQVALLLLFRSVTEHRSHYVHLGVASAGMSPGKTDFFQDRAGFLEPKA